MNAHMMSNGQGPISLPHKVEVQSVVSSRYDAQPSPERPQVWDDRSGGIDVVTVVGGDSLRLTSSPMQSVPKPGWVLMLTSGDPASGFAWTLYGMVRR